MKVTSNCNALLFEVTSPALRLGLVLVLPKLITMGPPPRVVQVKQYRHRYSQSVPHSLIEISRKSYEGYGLETGTASYILAIGSGQRPLCPSIRVRRAPRVSLQSQRILYRLVPVLVLQWSRFLNHSRPQLTGDRFHYPSTRLVENTASGNREPQAINSASGGLNRANHAPMPVYWLSAYAHS